MKMKSTLLKVLGFIGLMMLVFLAFHKDKSLSSFFSAPTGVTVVCDGTYITLP